MMNCGAEEDPHWILTWFSLDLDMVPIGSWPGSRRILTWFTLDLDLFPIGSWSGFLWILTFLPLDLDLVPIGSWPGTSFDLITAYRFGFDWAPVYFAATPIISLFSVSASGIVWSISTDMLSIPDASCARAIFIPTNHDAWKCKLNFFSSTRIEEALDNFANKLSDSGYYKWTMSVHVNAEYAHEMTARERLRSILVTSSVTRLLWM